MILILTLARMQIRGPAPGRIGEATTVIIQILVSEGVPLECSDSEIQNWSVQLSICATLRESLLPVS